LQDYDKNHLETFGVLQRHFPKTRTREEYGVVEYNGTAYIVKFNDDGYLDYKPNFDNGDKIFMASRII
jgi:hypothetical protein